MLKRFLPDSLFGQLAWLLAAVALVSHALALSLMFELRPPPPPPLPALHASDHRPLAPPTEKILLDIAVRLGAVLFAAWFGARWLSAPVQRLANATRELAENIHRPPLAEEGSRECREATGVINQLQRHILDQLQERDQFVAAVSHDLRTPLTRMALKVESLPNEIDRQRFKKDIEDMDHMIKATLGYLQGVASPEEADNLDLKSLLQSVVHDYQETHQKVELRNTCQGVGSTIQVRAQLSGIRRCLENLIDNAIRYGGEAAVEIENDSETVRIIVTDNGPGIPEGSLKMVLQPFYRLESSRNRSTGGVGLGLAITHDIVRRHAGSLVLINVPSGGLRAVLSLPISQITGTY